MMLEVTIFNPIFRKIQSYVMSEVENTKHLQYWVSLTNLHMVSIKKKYLIYRFTWVFYKIRVHTFHWPPFKGSHIRLIFTSTDRLMSLFHIKYISIRYTAIKDSHINWPQLEISEPYLYINRFTRRQKYHRSVTYVKPLLVIFSHINLHINCVHHIYCH